MGRHRKYTEAGKKKQKRENKNGINLHQQHIGHIRIIYIFMSLAVEENKNERLKKNKKKKRYIEVEKERERQGAR